MSKRAVCLGDSITEGIGDALNLGWVGRLNNHLAKTTPDSWRLCNLGVAGDTSIDIHHRLLGEVMYRTPDLLIIAAGLNDTSSRLWPDDDGPRVSLNYARDIWMQVIHTLKKSSIKTVFIGMTPVNEAKLPLVYMPYDASDRGHATHNERVRIYNSMLKKLVLGHELPFIDIFDTLMGMPFTQTLADGLHPSAAGYDMLFGLIQKEIEQLKVL